MRNRAMHLNLALFPGNLPRPHPHPTHQKNVGLGWPGTHCLHVHVNIPKEYH